MIQPKSVLDYRERDPLVAFQFGEAVEHTVLAHQTVAPIALLKRTRQDVGRRSRGRTGVRENGDLALFGRETQPAKSRNGSRWAAIVIVALVADAVRIHAS